MKTLLIVVASIGLFSITPSQSTTAYICNSPSAKKYHYSKTCRGLQKCTHEIKKTTVDSAKKSGYTVCLIES
ncbi:hypothetical protein H9Y05_01580 [Crocinitomicaceae bacterium CZZ-1]|uniref:Uncharacterized protein n=1 Tax=Taishania pollutisoli TaxID=2766479 RepID=A0A8J6TYM0_9FLAO|nr:hypothetical protein [Taishania pollutisoli]MBC9811153.1 hypothetical protein [Taishania pollutisoli]MBX2947931.1 hypothetical protein [Crocinitomicaceae bacterium]NGF76747.1 hypothetical protein [Fluviicola sp. SGL-29]